MGRFRGSLKIYKWWNSHLPMMGVAIYYQLLLAKPAPTLGTVLLTMVLFLVTSIGIAGFGQLMNDLFDIAQDQRTGSHNLLGGRSPAKRALQFGVVLLLALLPWLVLPATAPIVILIGFEFLLFIAYSVPPIRLKNRGLLGPIADALYAYTVPLSVSLLLFGRIGQVPPSIWFVAIVMVWTFLYGLEQILTHQLRDAARDEVDEIMTFVVRYGWWPTFRMMQRFLLPAQLASLVLLLLAMGLHAPIVPIGFVIFACWMAHRSRVSGLCPTANPWQMPEIDRQVLLTATIMGRFNKEWFPILVLIALAGHTPIYIVILLLHLRLFQNGVRTLVRTDLPEMRRLGRIV